MHNDYIIKKVIIIFFMVIGLSCCGSITCNALIVDSGECGANGNNVTWTLNDEGTVAISGKGEIKNYNSFYDSPFYNNENINRIVIEDGITRIGNKAFYCCTNLTDISIASSVTSIGLGSFNSCRSLTNITIPNSVVKIEGEVFWGCSSLKDIIIPVNVNSMGNFIFSDCSSLTDIKVVDNNNYFCSQNGVLYNKNKTEIIEYPGGKTDTSFTIPDSVKTIRPGAFRSCRNLERIIIQEGVTKIETETFGQCSNLTYIAIPKSITIIDGWAFHYCSSLKAVYYGGSKTDWGKITIYSNNDVLTGATIYYAEGSDDSGGGETEYTWTTSDEWSFKNYGVKPIKLTAYDYNKLTYDATPSEKKAFDDLVATSGEGGQCYGFAASAVLVNKNVIKPSDIKYGLFSLYQAERDSLTESFIGYHFLNQYTEEACETVEAFRRLSLRQQFNTLVKTPKPFVFSFGADKWGGHAVVATGVETGSWSYDGHTYDTRITTYDSNYPYSKGAEAREKSYLYFNSSTLEWEIPNYYSRREWWGPIPYSVGNITSDGDGYLKRACGDTSILNNLEYKIRNRKYDTWVRKHTDKAFQLSDANSDYTINGEIWNEDGITAYYDEGVMEDSESKPIINVLLDGSKDITIQPSDTAVLDVSVLYPECYLTASADTYSNVDLKADGEVDISGATGEYGISLTTDDNSARWNTVEISGNESDSIGAKLSDEGVIVNGEDLASLSFKGAREDEVDKLYFSSEDVKGARSILITSSNDEVQALIDEDGDGTYEKDITPDIAEKPVHTPVLADTTPVGSVHNISGSDYIVTTANTVSLVKAKSKKTYTLPDTVSINGKTFSVTGIQAGAFKGMKVKTVTVRTKLLTKVSVKGALKGSKVKMIKVKVGKKKVNKKYVKKYKKIFTKKNAGKKVKVAL